MWTLLKWLFVQELETVEMCIYRQISTSLSLWAVLLVSRCHGLRHSWDGGFSHLILGNLLHAIVGTCNLYSSSCPSTIARNWITSFLHGSAFWFLARRHKEYMWSCTHKNSYCGGQRSWEVNRGGILKELILWRSKVMGSQQGGGGILETL